MSFKSFRPLRGRVTFFAAAKKVTKESGFSPREQQLATQTFKRIFRPGILPRRKTAHIHVRRPTGLHAMTSDKCSFKSKHGFAVSIKTQALSRRFYWTQVVVT